MTKEITKTKLLDIAVVKTHTGQITIKPLVQVLEDFNKWWRQDANRNTKVDA